MHEVSEGDDLLPSYNFLNQYTVSQKVQLDLYVYCKHFFGAGFSSSSTEEKRTEEKRKEENRREEKIP